ncbi:RNA polymerase sigma-70 factor (ECF subfamily) [Dysgonomonas sp. PFB1-18]|uniref:RNA polymerase sigma-70 factor n=1 Tax=unclassified Dysgonomonas TaxID=2630389 RepID=UPI002474BA98|nr:MULTISPECIES: RNA polymerase sigma-70 factor [unclassified Dysgonomonas]MDH6307091.1 RNA polymerase sigma-70 factor (ECF subfamily) [Dysgonomonas sp. PF1-14]MDH6337010.1 RNA polymerase sigma-70 factor (ECF subfamily) [Dysgonomonas sp. PF1-16]MDH6380996.1 RNA polymerase sigma-70 factor (ECF subfamily) [Dysgonomonas sp. PFB1-18]MDH6396425.1 RNA polymerase sigma-70 factor (ECF subfamily) [Dysgonomonas sp. PF1-23]
MDSLNSSNYKTFYVTYYDRCFLFAKSYVHNDLVAEDIASETLIKLWELSTIEEIENPSRLLFVILKNKALDYLKHEKIKQSALESMSTSADRELEIRISTLEASNPDKIFADDIQNILRATIATLPEQTQKIFEMSRFKDVSKKDIADHFGISVKGVDYHISKALSSLRENLKDYFPIFLLLFINDF